jgi:NADPH2:quinone reductase
MKAVLVNEFGGPEVLVFKEVNNPNPVSNQVLIEVAAASVNFADITARQGLYHNVGKPPFIPGLDVAGTIVAVGENVQHLKVGQRVVAFPDAGSYAEFTIAREVLTYPIPDSVDFETAAAFPTVSITSYNLLANVARIQKGESVLIHAAAGGIGTTATQLAKILGAGTVIGTVSSDEKAKAALDAGADHVINYMNDNYAEKVNELTDGKGVDVILNSVAGDIFEQDLACLATFGRLAIFGHSAGKAGTVKSSDLHGSCRSVLGYSMGTNRKYRPEGLRESVKAVLNYVDEGKLKMVISKSFALEEAAAAHQWIESRKSTGKVLLKP